MMPWVNKFASTLIIIASVILLPLAVHYSIQIIKPAPSIRAHDWQDKEESKKAREEYDILRDDYDHTYFFVSAGAGLFFMIVGLMIKIPTVMIGVITGGFITLINGVLAVWWKKNPLIKLIFILIAFIFTVVIAYFLHRRQEKSEL